MWRWAEGTAIAGRLNGPLAAVLLLAATPALAQLEFYQTVDRDRVGTEDTFQLTVVVGNAPEGAQVTFPSSADFEILSRSQSTQMSYQLGGGGQGQIRRLQKYTLVLRANRAGTFTLPASVLTTPHKTYKTEAIRIEVRQGRTKPPGSAHRRSPGFGNLPDPFQNLPLPGLPDDFFEPPTVPQDFDIPRRDSDLFVRASLDKDEVYVGEQATLSVYIYSRVELSSVDSVTMPKLDGFWSEDLDSPTQLTAEQKTVGGVPYRAYLLRRRAIFPTKAGAATLQPVEADITTGFLFAGHRVHRRSNELSLKVKPLPPGAPASFSTTNVGAWRMSLEVTQTRVQLGEPVTARLTVEGRGNLKNVSLPELVAPSALRVYEPTTSDRVAVNHGKMGGRRVREYLVMPQQTGTFTLPGLALSYFNPETGKYEASRTEPIVLTVTPGPSGASAHSLDPAGAPHLGDAEKNKLEARGGLKPLRHQASFQAPAMPVWRRPFFWPLVLGPVVLWGGLVMAGAIRGRLRRANPQADTRRKARAARDRLAAAEKLRKTGASGEFYGEVEKALRSFLEAKLNMPISGLTRDQLRLRLSEQNYPPAVSDQVIRVLEACEMGRFAPGEGGAERGQILDEAAAAMEGLER